MWLLITTLAYFLFALVSVTDKYLLKKRIQDPWVFSFYTALLGLSLLVLLPFGFSVPSLSVIILGLAAGFVSISALFFLYQVLSRGEVSRIIPMVGSLVPAMTLLLSIYIFKEDFIFGLKEVLAFAFLVLGIFLITWKDPVKLMKIPDFGISQRYFLKNFIPLFLSSFLFALSFLLMKFVYLNQSFVSGLLWIKIGGFIFGIILLTKQRVRQKFSEDIRAFFARKAKAGEPSLDAIDSNSSFPQETAAIFIGKNAVGGIANIFLNLSISFAKFSQVPFVSALAGVQYIFILFLAVLLSKKLPHILKEEIKKEILIQKFIAVVLIGFGVFLLLV